MDWGVVTLPERLKGAKDEVKLEVGARRAPKLLVFHISNVAFIQGIHLFDHVSL